MKIQNVTTFAYKNNNLKVQNNKAKANNIAQSQTLYSPTTAQYLAFCGGLSLDLNHINSTLKDEEYPIGIKNLVQSTVKSGNVGNKTLYDIHNQKYKEVLNCFTLDELKEKFPEFSDVVSVYDVKDAKKDSVIDEFLQGNSKTFSPDEDLSLQLIKLYWGQGFSLTDLSNYAAKTSENGTGTNFYYAMTKKLNIPVMNQHYAKVLKISNRDYNEKFTQEMSIKRAEAREAKIQLAEGEPVIIPSRTLSEAHKQHISEGLKRYYQTNPEAIYKQTVRQKEFYEKNPEIKERMSHVMDYAWNRTQEGRSIKKYLNKFMKKHGTISDDKLLLKTEMTQSEKTLLEQFWKTNTWAKPKMSSAVKQGWEFIKSDVFTFFDGQSIPGYKISFNVAPRQIIEKVEKFAKENDIKTDGIKLMQCVACVDDEVSSSKPVQDVIKRGNSIIEKFTNKYPKEADNSTGAKHTALAILHHDLVKNSPDLPKSLKDDPAKRELMLYVMYDINNKVPIFGQWANWKHAPIMNTDCSKVDKHLTTVMTSALQLDCLDLVEYMNSKMDFAYCAIIYNDLDNISGYFL